jgi:short-subunit dehydrogenase
MKKVAIVTGASSELGLKVIEKLLNRGFKVYALARNVEKIGLKHESLSKKNLDLTSEDTCKEVFSGIGKESRNWQVLVNIAGVTLQGEVLRFAQEEFEKALKVNELGTFNAIKYFVNEKVATEKVKIINITSMTGLVSFPNFGIYSALKSAQEALGLAMRYEMKKYKVSITNIAPGAIEKKGSLEKKSKRKTAREKFKLLKLLMPILSSEYVAEKVVDVTEMKNPPARIILGSDAKILYFLQKILPFSLFEKLMFYVWNKK